MSKSSRLSRSISSNPEPTSKRPDEDILFKLQRLRARRRPATKCRRRERRPLFAKRLECDQLTGAFALPFARKSESKLHALQTLRARRTPATKWRRRPWPAGPPVVRVCGIFADRNSGHGGFDVGD